jgi:hypothetical protein
MAWQSSVEDSGEAGRYAAHDGGVAGSKLDGRLWAQDKQDKQGRAIDC